jgi:hypothetical protein
LGKSHSIQMSPQPQSKDPDKQAQATRTRHPASSQTNWLNCNGIALWRLLNIMILPYASTTLRRN